jgi:hypothetical protein
VLCIVSDVSGAVCSRSAVISDIVIPFVHKLGAATAIEALCVGLNYPNRGERRIEGGVHDALKWVRDPSSVA